MPFPKRDECARIFCMATTSVSRAAMQPDPIEPQAPRALMSAHLVPLSSGLVSGVGSLPMRTNR
jgi:hypothetical protein